MQCTCVEASTFVMFLHSFIQIFPLICHPSYISLFILSFTLSIGDLTIQQFSKSLSLEVRNEELLSFKPMEKRLDVFLHRFISKLYPEPWAFLQKLLLLSHGQATVERGFSINNEVEICNIKEDTIIAHRIVCDYVLLHGGVRKVALIPELLTPAAAARTRYLNHLENERRRKESQA